MKHARKDVIIIIVINTKHLRRHHRCRRHHYYCQYHYNTFMRTDSSLDSKKLTQNLYNHCFHKTDNSISGTLRSDPLVSGKKADGPGRSLIRKMADKNNYSENEYITNTKFLVARFFFLPHVPAASKLSNCDGHQNISVQLVCKGGKFLKKVWCYVGGSITR